MKILFFGASSEIARSITRKIKVDVYGISTKYFKNSYKELYKVNKYSPNEIKKILKKKKIKFDHIFFFNGIYEHSLLRNFDIKNFSKVLDINYNIIISSSLLMIKSKFLKEKGSICFITSKAADRIEIGNAYYSLSKKLLSLSSQILSKEFRNIYRFNCISTGFIKSKMSSEILNFYTKGQKKKILNNQNNNFISKSKLINKINLLCFSNSINGKIIKIHR